MRVGIIPILFLPLVLSTTALRAQSGSTHGGQLPVVGAHVFLFAANTTGYGAASVSLLKSVTGSTTLDNSGGPTNGDYYVTTNSNGIFNITGDYSCTPGTQVYSYSIGGNSGYGVNSGIGELGILGNCPAAGNFGSGGTDYMTEATTIAVAYAISGFATDALHISSSGTALAKVGIATAFTNSGNLASNATGYSFTTAADATVPESTIYTLANILAACVNSNGSGACPNLFMTATSTGLSGGTKPTETATAAINIAHHPGANVATLYAFNAMGAVFSPSLSSQPNDFTIGLRFTGSYWFGFYSLAIDAAGNAWVGNTPTQSLIEISSSGSLLSPANGYTGGGIANPWAIAIDGSGDAWIANQGSSTLTELSPTGSPILSAGQGGLGGLSSPRAIAIDGSGNEWLSNSSNSVIAKFNSAGGALSGSGYPGGGSLSLAIDVSGRVWSPGSNGVVVLSNSGIPVTGSPFANGGGGEVAIDHAGSAWMGNGSALFEVSSTGHLVSGTNGYTGGGLNGEGGIAIDGAGSVWLANSNASSVTEFSNAGVVLSGSTGYEGGGMTSPVAIALDGSGDVWTITEGPGAVTELIGAAVPVVTPLSAGVKSNGLGARP